MIRKSGNLFSEEIMFKQNCWAGQAGDDK